MTETKTCLRKELEEMSSEQLDNMLQTELQKEQPEENTVLPILQVLKEREAGKPVHIGEAADAAWERFTANTGVTKPGRSSHSWIAGIAAAAVIVCLAFFAIPQNAEAGTLFDRLLHLTDSVLQFFDLGRDPGDVQKEYVFTTDHPGLQQLHDELAELGITEPVVPMWLPEGYELTELITSTTLGYGKVVANFSDGTRTIAMQYKMASETTSVQYELNSQRLEVYESYRRYHTIIENDENLSAAWEIDGVECLIAADLEKEMLYAIIDSIYRRNTP